MLLCLRFSFSAAASHDPWLPIDAVGKGNTISFAEVAELGVDALNAATSSALCHAIAAPSSRIIREPFNKEIRNRLIYGHDVTLRQSLWEEHGIRPAVDVGGYRQLRKRSKGKWGSSSVDWVARVDADVDRLRQEVLERYGSLYHHSDLLNIYSDRFLETVALKSACRKKRAKLPFVCLRQSLGAPLTELQQSTLREVRCGAAAVGEASLYAYQHQQIKVDDVWMSRLDYLRLKGEGKLFNWKSGKEEGVVVARAVDVD